MWRLNDVEDTCRPTLVVAEKSESCVAKDGLASGLCCEQSGDRSAFAPTPLATFRD